jgi:hypothetical protein
VNAHTFLSIDFDDATKARIDEFAQLVKRAEDTAGALRRESARAADERVLLVAATEAACYGPNAAREDARRASAVLGRYLDRAAEFKALIEKVGPALTRAAATVETQAEQSAKAPAPRPQPGVSTAPALRLQPGKFYEDTRGYKWCVYDVNVSGTMARAVKLDNAFTRRFATDGKALHGYDLALVREVAP